MDHAIEFHRHRCGQDSTIPPKCACGAQQTTVLKVMVFWCTHVLYLTFVDFDYGYNMQLLDCSLNVTYLASSENLSTDVK
eukprot:2869229-Amphidinium_carterae.1